MSNKSLKNLSEVLKISEGYLKGLLKGDKKSKSNFIVINTANACRAVARFTGYKTEESAERAIRSNVNLLYLSAEKLATRIQKLSSKYGKVKRAILEKAAQALMNYNFSEYNKLLKSTKSESLMKFLRKSARTCDRKLLDKLRNYKRSTRTAARLLLTAAKSPNGYKIVVPQSAIDKEVLRRLKRYGSIASLFWQAAKKLNPKIKSGDLPKEKRKKLSYAHGARYRTRQVKGGAEVTVNHFIENKNPKFKSKLNKTIKRQEKFWAQQCEKLIVAAAYLNKLLDKA